MLDIGQQQIDVLLLMRNAELRQFRQFGARQQRRHGLAYMSTPVEYFRQRGARQHPA